jgi:tetratricopeptide (TPR) repeat protein
MTAWRSGRVAVVAAVTAVLVGPASAAPVPKGAESKSWVGKTVLPKHHLPVAHSPAIFPDGTPHERSRILHAASWEVKAEKGARVEVTEEGEAAWLEKDEVVLLPDAVEFYTKQIEADPKADYPYNFRGWAKYLLGKPDEAVKDFDEFLNRYPAGGGEASGWHRRVGLSNRGLVLAEVGKFDAAIKDLDEAVKLRHPPAQLNRGWAYELKGDYQKAAEDYAAILHLRPGDVLALNNMAWLKATCPDAAFRDGKEAVKLAKKACELTGNREGTCLDTLAAAHAEAGDFAAAVAAQEKALQDAGYVRKEGVEAQNRLRLYQGKKPYRSQPRK